MVEMELVAMWHGSEITGKQDVVKGCEAETCGAEAFGSFLNSAERSAQAVRYKSTSYSESSTINVSPRESPRPLPGPAGPGGDSELGRVGTRLPAIIVSSLLMGRLTESNNLRRLSSGSSSESSTISSGPICVAFDVVY